AWCLPIPKRFTLQEASSLPETFFTVWNNLFDRARLAIGEWVLIHGGTGGIGITAIQLAKAFVATVVTTAASEEQVAFCRAIGADYAINYRTQDLGAEVKRLTNGRGVDGILDMVGGDYMDRSLKSLAADGRLSIIAFLKSSKVECDLRNLMVKRL